MIGNFIADSVRRSQWSGYKPKVVMGMELHHKIDFYTDNHPVVDASKKRLRPYHSKYSPVVADIMYDHFLACKFKELYGLELDQFVEGVYAMFRRRWEELPRVIQNMIPHMEKENWLLNYGNREGLARVFRGMSRRASFKNQMQDATEDIFRDYKEYEAEFDTFYPDLQEYCRLEIEKMNNAD